MKLRIHEYIWSYLAPRLITSSHDKYCTEMGRVCIAINLVNRPVCTDFLDKPESLGLLITITQLNLSSVNVSCNCCSGKLIHLREGYLQYLGSSCVPDTPESWSSALTSSLIALDILVYCSLYLQTVRDQLQVQHILW